MGNELLLYNYFILFFCILRPHFCLLRKTVHEKSNCPSVCHDFHYEPIWSQKPEINLWIQWSWPLQCIRESQLTCNLRTYPNVYLWLTIIAYQTIIFQENGLLFMDCLQSKYWLWTIISEKINQKSYFWSTIIKLYD